MRLVVTNFLSESFVLAGEHLGRETMETMKALFSWAPKSLWTVIATMKLKDAYLLEEKQ